MLRFGDGRVVDERWTVRPARQDRVDELAESARCERVRGQAADRGVDGSARGECVVQRGRIDGLDADDADATGEPRRDAAEQSAAADRPSTRSIWPTCSSSSAASVPVPSIVSRWSYGWTSSAPDSADHAVHAANESPMSSPPTTSSAP